MAKKKLNTYRLLKSIEDTLEYEFDREFTINANSDEGTNNG